MHKKTLHLALTTTLTLSIISVVLGCALPKQGNNTTQDPTSQGQSAPTTSTGKPASEVITDEDGHEITITRGAKGDPAQVGCADGQREGLINLNTYPRIAACLGSWSGQKSLRAAPTGRACGDGIGSCSSPADICAVGWHICGQSGDISEVKQLTAQQCRAAGNGRFSAAISHCETQDGCVYDDAASGGDGDGKYACYDQGWCSEPVCCGEACGEFGACTGGIWPEQTHIAQGMDQGCGQLDTRRAGGVLCCKD